MPGAFRLLTGKARINLPLKAKEKPAEIATSAPAAAAPTVAAPAFTGPVTTQCTVVEGGVTRNFRITIEPPVGTSTAVAVAPAAGTVAAPAPAAGQRTPVFSPFEGKVELVEISVKVGDAVTQGQVVAAVEAMKAKHDVRAPCAGTVVEIHADLGGEVSASKPILTIGG